jgi:hypothetical protein
MHAAELLVAIAQIAVSLAGFSGLIAALRATTGEWHPRDIWSLSWMLGSSTGALMLALFPLWLALSVAAEDELYRISCAVAAVALGMFFAVMFVSDLRLTRRGFPRRVTRIHETLSLMTFGAALVDALGALGLLGRWLIPAYFAGLMALLLGAVLALCVFLILLARSTGNRQ